MSKHKHFCFNEEKKELTINEFKKSKICRFKASERLVRYSIISNWVFSILSLSLILISLINVFGFIPIKSEGFFNFFQLGLSIIILVVFQIITSSDYNVKALRFHQCGMEISAEIRKLENICVKKLDDKAVDKIKRSLNEYTSILKRYDNHKQIDYLVYTLQEKSLSKIDKSKNIFFRMFYEFISYLPHIFLFILTLFGLYLSFDFTCWYESIIK